MVTGEGGKARDDVLAALARRGWAGRLVWGFAPVQDRHAAPAIVRALGELVAVGGVEVAIVARGGGSLADLLCFCDETLCRTVALLGVPVIASVGHHTDRTLLDDVAAVSCSTPTHAAEAAVGVDCARARAEQAALPRACAITAASVQPRAGCRRRGAPARPRPPRVLTRARLLASLSRAPAAHLDRQRARLHQQLREIRAGSRRRVESERRVTERRAVVLERKAASFALDCRERRPRELAQLALALAGHDPQRTLERGYVLAQSPDGEPIVTRRRGTRRPRAAAALRRRLTAGEGDRAMSEQPRRASTRSSRSRSARRRGRSAPRLRHPPPRHRPTRRRPRASRRSSAGWTRARRASMRRSRSSARARR